MDDLKTRIVAAAMTWWFNMILAICSYYVSIVGVVLCRHRISRRPYNVDFHSHKAHFRSLVYSSDVACHNLKRMNKATLDNLCAMLNAIGELRPTRHMLIDEQVTIFAYILSHHVKNRVIQVNFKRSRESVSRHFNWVLNAMMHLDTQLFKNPEPVPADSADPRWKWFKNCVGALEGTHLNIKVLLEDKARYRNRHGDITTNVLSVCSQDGQFIYVSTC